jgi:hypothetical protein
MAIDIKKQYYQIQRGKVTLLRTLGANGVKMFKVNNFEAQGFIDSGVSRWKKKKANDGRKTLVKTSVMRNTIFYKVVRGKIEFGTLAKYGRRHNEGLDGMPKRQFMGESAALNKINGRTIGLFIKKIMK